LREFFEAKFGPVVDAIVIGSHAGDHIQSRGFGFVTFKNEEAVIAAVQVHYVNIFGKKVVPDSCEVDYYIETHGLGQDLTV
jgi:RNA recognition motif-containing protein